MSVVFDVSAVGPTLGLDVVSSSPAAAVYVVDRPPAGGASSASAAQDKTQAYVSSAISSESSSIGVHDDDSDDDDEEGEVQSKADGSYLSSLASLEESLPIKRRGLSNNFAGKSKSFANLSEISTVREIEKRENPLNKRRRTMIAYNWSRKSSLFSCKGNNSSMSILALKGVIGEGREEDDDDDDDDDDDESKEEDQRFRQQQLKGSQSCFSLTDLPK